MKGRRSTTALTTTRREKREDRTEILRMNDGEKELNSDAARWAETGSECRIGR
ncbi:uncharacterized protein DS421_18g629020 [Arachis hypogaea]|nr:uncharacterized protein DS421_18g629020 [Arachis hypogaea]